MHLLPSFRSRIRLPWLIVFGVAWLSLHAFDSWATSAIPAEEAYQYREVTGKSIKEVNWQLTKGDTFVLTYTAPGERYVTVTGPGYDTIRWSVTNDIEQTELSAQRQGNAIVLSGRFRGRPIHKTLEIDDGPWYQATSLSLRALIASGDSERVFWTIRYETLTAHRIKAIKKEMETAESNDHHLPLLHIRLTLPGLMAPFWKSDYWFSMPDGIFFRFEGPSGPPGSPTTTVTRTAG